MPSKEKTALLIINPHSRTGAEADLQEGIAMLQAAGFILIQIESGSAQHMAHLIEQYHMQVGLVIIGGGDGTINSAAAALYRHQLALAILPLGTANDLARSLNLPRDLRENFTIIANNQRCKMDLGAVNGHYFFNAANIGLGVGVTHALTPEIKKKWGVFSYLKAAFIAFKSNRSFRASINVDGKEYRMRSIQLAIGNGRYYGGGNVIDEHATISDGLLNIYSLQPQSFWQLLSLAPILRIGKQWQVERIFNAAGRRITIKTKPRREVYADGEPVSKTPVVFEVIPDAIEVICAAPLP